MPQKGRNARNAKVEGQTKAPTISRLSTFFHHFSSFSIKCRVVKCQAVLVFNGAFVCPSTVPKYAALPTMQLRYLLTTPKERCSMICYHFHIIGAVGEVTRLPENQVSSTTRGEYQVSSIECYACRDQRKDTEEAVRESLARRISGLRSDR